MAKDGIEHIGELITDNENARAHNPRNVGLIVEALQEVGAARSIVIDEAGRILAGNATIEAAALAGIERVKVVEADGETIVAVRRSGLTEEQKKRLALYDNRTAELADWDIAQLAADLEAGFDLSGLWSELELADLGLDFDEPDDGPEQARLTLAERFIVPPFSVLDARQGYWQERKRAWLALGIQSELGRGEAVTWGIAPSGEGTGKYSDKAYTDSARAKREKAGAPETVDGHGRPITQRERES